MSNIKTLTKMIIVVEHSDDVAVAAADDAVCLESFLFGWNNDIPVGYLSDWQLM